MASKKLQAMAERYERPDWVRFVNAMAGAVGGSPRDLVPLDGQDLLQRAFASLGEVSGDFGDPGWQQRFEDLVDVIDRSELHLVGRMLSKEELLRALRSRLLLTRQLAERPAIADEEITAPMIVTGPARSGTTILFELLWLDKTVRAPLAWEALHPLPLPEDATGDAREAWSSCEQEIWAVVQPEFAAIHELRSDLPVECVTLTASSFAGSHWGMVVDQMDKAVWAPDTNVDFVFHKKILQSLQHGSEKKTWLLKTPGHLMALNEVFATYPDAWVVQTHRDPAKTMPSTVSTTAMVRWLRHDHVDLDTLALMIGGAFGWALNNTVDVRTSAPYKDRFVDVHFKEMLRDPVETLRKAYDGMGREFSEEHAEGVRTYLRDKPKGKFGTHKYTPEDWGFTREALHEQLAPYIQHFSVELE